MKRLSMLFILLFALLLSGCGWLLEKEPAIGFFDEDLLAACKLAQMPLPAAGEEEIRHNGNKVYLNLSDEERIAYANEVKEYLLEKEDIYYKGYHYDTGCPGGIFYLPEYRFKPLTENVEDAGGWFAFSLTSYLNEGDSYNCSYWNGVSVCIYYEEGERGTFDYNTVIEIDEKAAFCVYSSGKHTEHTGEYWADEDFHRYRFTCDCPYTCDTDPHCDNDDDGRCDVCEYVMDGGSLVESGDEKSN